MGHIPPRHFLPRFDLSPFPLARHEKELELVYALAPNYCSLNGVSSEKGKFIVMLLLLLGNTSFGLYLHLYSFKLRHRHTALSKTCKTPACSWNKRNEYPVQSEKYQPKERRRDNMDKE